MYKFYEVDPEADTLLIIPYPPKTFAPWQQADTPPPSPRSAATADTSVYAGILRGTSRPPNIYASIASSPEVRIKVSSKHLSLASKHFCNKFRHLHQVQGSLEAEDGRVHITLAGYDPAAVIIVMDIIHGRGRKVPRAVDLETLAKVAVFVDAFRCAEAVEVYAERWFEKLDDGPVPTEYGRDLVLRLYAAYIFRKVEAFKKATQVAVLQSDGPIRSLGLQVREGVIREIDARRQQLVNKSLDAVHETTRALTEATGTTTPSCHLGCDTLLLGALIRTLNRNQLVWPRPIKPFAGVSFASIKEAVGEAEAQVDKFVPSLLSLSSPSSKKRKSPNAQPGQALTPDSSPEIVGKSAVAHECSAKSGLADRLREFEASVEGLELESKYGYYLY